MPSAARVLRASVSASSAPSASWSSTLRLPKSTFPARPSAEERSKYLARCTTQLYEWQKHARHNATEFVLHDGPPYANGSLHIGHALNKILKDIILRVQLAKGRQIRYVPGWDCHGLPIELKALQKQREPYSGSLDPQSTGKEDVGTKKYDAVAVRTLARDLASETVQKQRDEFREWAILGDWDNAWTTMQPDFELRQLEVFRRMLEKGMIYRRFKPVYWSPSTQTALAEGELEYKADHTSTAAFVRFKLDDQGLAKKLFGLEGEESQNVSLLIWTTTPWTLPANQAIAVRDDMRYVCAYFEGIGHLIIAESRLHEVEKLCKLEHKGPVAGPVYGSELVGTTYRNDAFINGQSSRVLHADYVSEGSGTGLVHTAPGHGMDDYKLCFQHGIAPFTPVDSEGRFTEEAVSGSPRIESLAGKQVLGDGAVAILKYLKTASVDNSMQIIKSYKYTHNYPYDWRSKQPVIIRATAQWFADLGEIRDLALKDLQNIRFIPSSGRERLESMIQNRTEWCISRQRAWGVPIPALYRKDNGEPLLTPDSAAHMISTIRERGIDAWWTDPPDDIAWIPPPQRGSDYVRGTDTMDVWFDSGTSWTHIGRQADDATTFRSVSSDVYLEGSDQHRGWFQSSILTKIAYDSAVGDQATAPFRTLITHGFTLDGSGRKMSKSEGNVISPDEIVKGTLLPAIKRKGRSKTEGTNPPSHDSLGSDALRLLVASLDYTKDVQVGTPILKVIHSSLAKFRVTFRLLTGLLADFEAPDPGATRLHQLGLVNQIALLDLSKAVRRYWDAVHDHEFHKAFAVLNEYVNSDFSAFFVEAVKDRMYTGAAEGKARKATQFVLWHVFEDLCAMLRPLTPLLVEEANAHLPERLRGEHTITARRLFSADDLDMSDDLVFTLSSSAPATLNRNDSDGRNVDIEGVSKMIPTIMHLNATVKSLLEEKRGEKVIGSSLQASVLVRDVQSELCDSDQEPTRLQDLPGLEEELADIFVVSRVVHGTGPAVKQEGWSTTHTITEGPAHGFEITLHQPLGEKCERCWKCTASKDDVLCQGCEDVVGTNEARQA